MPDYIYLLEHRLSPAQREAIRVLRDVARDESMTLFLTGGAVRDLTTGSPVRDLDFSVQGNALRLKDRLLERGAAFWGEHLPSQTLFVAFPGGVRVEVASTRRETFPKPGEPEYHWDTILEDLRRRDFTANAMALSLNDMSYGLLMDPMNGIADIESRTLRLVSNYGFLEAPVRMLRAARLAHRLAWHLDEKTQQRLQNARDEGMMQQLSSFDKGYELEEIGHEENPLEMLRALEAEGWMQELFPSWTAASADISGLEQMHEVLTRLQMQGVYPDASTAAMELLTAHMPPKELEALKATFVRQGFVREWARLDEDAQEFAKQLTAKEANAPSATWRLFQTVNPTAVLWLGLTGKGTAIQTKYKNFFYVWPESKQQVPTVLMQEMRITPELPKYGELLENYFYALIDGRLKSEEEIRAFLEPYSPPAPPPPVNLRRPRAAKKAETKKSSAAAKTAQAPPATEEGAAAAESAAPKKAAKPAAPKLEAVAAKAVSAEKPKEAKAATKPAPAPKKQPKEVPKTAVHAKDGRPAGKSVANGKKASPEKKQPTKKAAPAPKKVLAKKAPVKNGPKKAAKPKPAAKKVAAKPAKKKAPVKVAHKAKKR